MCHIEKLKINKIFVYLTKIGFPLIPNIATPFTEVSKKGEEETVIIPLTKTEYSVKKLSIANYNISL